ncbi:MAG: MXAN_5187 C-terminal domain-containing protein [Acidobacteriota bacterium]
MDIEGRIERVEDDLRLFQVEFERFFRGERATPPEEIRQRVLGDLRNLRTAKLQGVADTFRVSQLEARFNSYSELFNRRTRDFEMGGRRRVVTGTYVDVDRGVIFGERVDQKAAEALYRGLHRRGAEPRFDLETFQGYLDRQREAIRAKTGCSHVQFRLSDEAGRTKLKAKPVTTGTS